MRELLNAHKDAHSYACTHEYTHTRAFSQETTLHTHTHTRTRTLANIQHVANPAFECCGRCCCCFCCTTLVVVVAAMLLLFLLGRHGYRRACANVCVCVNYGLMNRHRRNYAQELMHSLEARECGSGGWGQDSVVLSGTLGSVVVSRIDNLCV